VTRLEAAGVREGAVLDTVDGLASAWDAVAVGCGSPLHHYAWVRTCADRFSTRSNLCVVVAGDPRQPVAMAPLIRRYDGPSYLEPLGVRELHEPMDLIYRHPADALALTTAVAALGLPLSLPRIRADSPTISAVREAWRNRGVVICRPRTGWPWIELDENWASAEPPLKPSRRSDLRRTRRRAESLGPLNCHILSPAPEDVGPLLDVVLSVEGASWKSRAGTALASDRAMSVFFRAYAACACEAGVLRLCFLRVGDRTAAVQFALESEDRFWLLKIGYDESYARCSPGALLLAETIRYAAQRGLRSYEFLGVPEPWTDAWTDRERACVAVRAYPARASGVATFASDMTESARLKLGRLLSRMP